MEALEMLLTRRSVVVRAMHEPGPSPTELESILDAGIRVPDHGKLYPWRIQVLESEAQAQLGDHCAGFFADDHPSASIEELALERHRPARAPILLVVSNRILPDHQIPESEQYLSGGALCQNLLNATHALGYAAQWLTEWPAYDARVGSILGHEPENEMIAWIHIGSTSKPPEERRRATLHDVVTRWPDEAPQK